MILSDFETDLGTRLIGQDIIQFDLTDSTNLRARLLAEEGRKEGTVVLADCQNSGKGRLGRTWISPAGVNFYASLILRPAIPPRQATQVTFLASLAAVRALHESFGVPAEVKWPNDVLLNGKKVGGILNELCASVEKINYMILGVGINLNMTREQLPERRLFPATSVFLEKGEKVSRPEFACNFFRLLDQFYPRYLAEGFCGIREEWESFCGMLGCRVELDTGETTLNGIAEGIAEDGALLVRLDDGSREKILSADIRSIHK